MKVSIETKITRVAAELVNEAHGLSHNEFRERINKLLAENGLDPDSQEIRLALKDKFHGLKRAA